MSYDNNYLEVVEKWLNEKTLEDELKSELLKMTDQEKKEAFYQDLSFGTGGIRGLMGVGTNRLNVYIIKKVALGYANFFKNKFKKTHIRVAISFDNRINSKLFANAIAEVLAAEGIKTFITKNLRPTPFLSFLVRHFKADGGVMITASHNPKEYNGIKIYDEHGGQIMPLVAEEITKEINLVKNYFNIETIKNELIHYLDDEYDDLYLNNVLKVQLNEDQRKPYLFVYTPLHGTGAVFINKIADKTGYYVLPLEKQMVTSGLFPDAKNSNPEDKEAYELALKKAKEVSADAVLATDPDSDRLGIVVKHNNEYHFLNGNQTVILQLNYLLSIKKQRNTLVDGIAYYTNVTTPLFKEIANYYNIETNEVLTGFKYIGNAILLAKKPFIFGGEESYGSLILPFVRDKDAFQPLVLLMEMVTYYLNLNKTLVDVLNELYEKFGYYQEETLNFIYQGQKGQEQIKKIINYYYNNKPKYVQEEPIKILNYFNDTIKTKEGIKKGNLPFAEVIKYIYPTKEITFRPSGTEPKLKIYVHQKGKTIESAVELLKETLEALHKENKEF